MYTILMQDDKSLVATVTTTIYQRESLVDKIQFLLPQTYEDITLSDCTVVLKYVDPGNVAHSETLTMDEDLYKDTYLRCEMDVDTDLTRFAGDITVRLTFLQLDTDGLSTEVLHSGETVITITPLSDLYAFDADGSLEVLDQKILELQAMLEAMAILTESIDTEKADDLSYEDNTLQLLANGEKIGTAYTIVSCDSCDDTDDSEDSGSDSDNTASDDDVDEMLDEVFDDDDTDSDTDSTDDSDDTSDATDDTTDT